MMRTRLQSKKFNFNAEPTVNAVRYKPLECHNEQADSYSAMNGSEEILETDWCEELTLQDEYSAYRDKFISVLVQFESMWDG